MEANSSLLLNKQFTHYCWFHIFPFFFSTKQSNFQIFMNMD